MTKLSLPVDCELPSPELKTAFDAALAGANVIAHYFERGVAMRSKADDESYNLVSDADVESEQAIARTIQAAFPEHAILGEEENSGLADAAHLWIVDPLDGTNNFAHRIPHFAVSVAYYRNSEPFCGVVVNPVRGDWYWAQKEHGAFHNGRRLQVSPAENLKESMIGCGFYYDRGAMMEATLQAVHDFFKQDIHGIRRFGTAALDFCQVADGLFEAFFEYQLHPWDLAAGRLIVEEAGGKVTNGYGQPIPIAQSSVLVSNAKLHAACLEIVQRHHPE
ncbi:MAG: inositol monophosphatase family protein [Planctomycetota bacterium]